MYETIAVAMGTVVSIEVISDRPEGQIRPAVQRALGWFRAVEARCSRFDDGSELRQLLTHVGRPVTVSPLLFEILRFSLALARETRGAFDPTVGARMESQGFDRHYATGGMVSSGIPVDMEVSYRDVKLDPKRTTVTLTRPLVLDLGGVAKGFALDLAAREISAFDGFCVDAGGDLVVGGRGPQGGNWQIGVQHPREPGAVFCGLNLSNQAVCTSGDYERPAPSGAGHHLLDPRTGRSPAALTSATVIAPSALLADGFATAAVVLGPAAGVKFLESHEAQGVLVTAAGETCMTAGLARLLL